MKRRRFIQGAAAAGLSVSLAGCSMMSSGSSSDGPSPDGSGDTVQIGESIEENGLEVVVEDYALVDRYGVYREPWGEDEARPPEDEDDYEKPPTAGGQFLMLHLKVKNTGENEKTFPLGEQMTLRYGGNEKPGFFPDNDFDADGSRYKSYVAEVTDNNANENGAYPGVSISGMVMFEVPKQFNRRLVKFSMVWGEDGNGDGNWTLVPPEDYEGDEKDPAETETTEADGNETSSDSEDGESAETTDDGENNETNESTE